MSLLSKYKNRPLRWWLATPLYAYRLTHQYFQRDGVIWTTAQYGEDVMLLKMLGPSPRYCVEVGANDGLHNSNTYLFDRLGWQGLLVEPSPEVASRCCKNRPHFTTVQAAVVAPGGPTEVTFQVVAQESQWSFMGNDPLHLEVVERHFGLDTTVPVTVPARTLDALLVEVNAPAKLAFVTIDVEGLEADVLDGFSIRRWRPEVVIVERNGPEFDPRIVQYMNRHGYHHWQTTPLKPKNGGDWNQAGNDWYVPNDQSLPGGGAWINTPAVLLAGVVLGSFVAGLLLRKRRSQKP